VPARTCPVCASTVRVPDGKAGQTFECPECGEPVSASERPGSRGRKIVPDRKQPVKPVAASERPGDLTQDRRSPRDLSYTIAIATAVLIILADLVLMAWFWLATMGR